MIDLPASNPADQEHTKLIKARLSYPIKQCRHCGFAAVVKNGFRKAHVRLRGNSVTIVANVRLLLVLQPI